MSEAPEKERRKLNIIIFNIPTTTDFNFTNSSSDSDTVKTLFQSLLNASSLPFICNRLGKKSLTTSPLVVKFLCEDDKLIILKNASKLRNMSDRWPKVSIAPDRTKQEQILCKNFRSECLSRQARGEHVIVNQYRIVPHKRYNNNSASNASDNPVPALSIASAPINSSVCHAESLRVNLQPIKTIN